MNHSLLKVKGVTKIFGGIKAISDLSFEVSESDIFGLIGPNGAGKTTLFNCVSGLYRQEIGNIFFNGKLINGLRTSERCKLGIGRTFQIVKPLNDLTVLDNVITSAFCNNNNLKKARKKAESVLSFVNLSHKDSFFPENLTLADKKRLEFARALATECKLLLLDEVMAGLNPAETKEIMSLVRQVNAEGVTILLIEHVMSAVMNLCSRIVVLNLGAKIAEGTPQEIVCNPEVIKAYLGEDSRYAAQS